MPSIGRMWSAAAPAADSWGKMRSGSTENPAVAGSMTCRPRRPQRALAHSPSVPGSNATTRPPLRTTSRPESLARLDFPPPGSPTSARPVLWLRRAAPSGSCRTMAGLSVVWLTASGLPVAFPTASEISGMNRDQRCEVVGLRNSLMGLLFSLPGLKAFHSCPCPPVQRSNAMPAASSWRRTCLTASSRVSGSGAPTAMTTLWSISRSAGLVFEVLGGAVVECQGQVGGADGQVLDPVDGGGRRHVVQGVQVGGSREFEAGFGEVGDGEEGLVAGGFVGVVGVVDAHYGPSGRPAGGADRVGALVECGAVEVFCGERVGAGAVDGEGIVADAAEHVVAVMPQDSGGAGGGDVEFVGQSGDDVAGDSRVASDRVPAVLIAPGDPVPQPFSLPGGGAPGTSGVDGDGEPVAALHRPGVAGGDGRCGGRDDGFPPPALGDPVGLLGVASDDGAQDLVLVVGDEQTADEAAGGQVSAEIAGQPGGAFVGGKRPHGDGQPVEQVVGVDAATGESQISDHFAGWVKAGINAHVWCCLLRRRGRWRRGAGA